MVRFPAKDITIYNTLDGYETIYNQGELNRGEYEIIYVGDNKTNQVQLNSSSAKCVLTANYRSPKTCSKICNVGLTGYLK